MNLLRRRMMMQTEKSGAKYPLVNGQHEFSEGSYVEVTNGNHVLCQKSNSDTLGFINISDIFKNTASLNSARNIDFLPLWFTIPSGVIAKFELKNIQGIGEFITETNFRIANQKVSGSFHAGQFNASNPNNTIIEKTLDASESVSCLFIYASGRPSTRIEFDVEFTVNGERWI